MFKSYYSFWIDEWYVWVGGLIILALFVWGIVYTFIKKKKFEAIYFPFVKAFDEIQLGETKDEVFSKLTIKPWANTIQEGGIEIYEWRYKIRGEALTFSYEYGSTTTYNPGYSILMCIKFLNGKVFEKIAKNNNLEQPTDDAVKNYEKISLGQTKEDTLKLMGKGYCISLLNDGTEQYCWSFRKEGGVATVGMAYGVSGSSIKGATETNIVVKFRNGAVVEKTNAL